VSLPKSFFIILSEEETVVRVDFTDVLRPETRTEDTSRFTLKQQAQQQVASLVLDDRDLQKLSEWDYL
jgi:1-acyl-sn-glycerol-3-phosphate acyltransferase